IPLCGAFPLRGLGLRNLARSLREYRHARRQAAPETAASLCALPLVLCRRSSQARQSLCILLLAHLAESQIVDQKCLGGLIKGPVFPEATDGSIRLHGIRTHRAVLIFRRCRSALHQIFQASIDRVVLQNPVSLVAIVWVACPVFMRDRGPFDDPLQLEQYGGVAALPNPALADYV